MDLVDKVREVSSLVEIASQYTTLNKRGRKWVGICPFHTEKTPSFTIDEDKQLYHCFGCGAGGDIFTLVMEKENLNFPEAVNYLAERFHIPVPQQQKPSSESARLQEKLFQINEQARTFFQQNLLNTPEGKKALDYLRTRGITKETIEKLGLGYALNSWDSLVSYLKSKQVPISILEKSGLVIPGQKTGEYHDRFRGRIIFPIYSLTGKVLAFGGRTVFEADPKYLNSPDTPTYSKGKVLYGLNVSKNEVKESGNIVLVEGYMDFISLYQAGIRNAAASLGTALTAYQIALIKRFSSKIFISYDPDKAGIAAASRAVPLCWEKGLQVDIVRLPEKLDPDSFIKKYGRDKYLHLVKRSVPGLKFLISTHASNINMSVPEEKAGLARTIVKELEKITDPLIRNDYLRQTSDYLKVREEDLRQVISRTQTDSSNQIENGQFFLPAEKRLFQIIVQNKSIIKSLSANLKVETFKGLPTEPAFKNIILKFEQGEAWEFADLKDLLPPKLFFKLSQTIFEKSSPGTVEEAQECLWELEKISLQKQLAEIQRKIIQSEKQGQQESLLSLLYEKQKIIRKIMTLSEMDRTISIN